MRPRLTATWAGLALIAGATVTGPAAAGQPEGPAAARAVMPLRTIPAGSIIGAGDVALQPVRQPPAADVVQTLAAAVGKEAQRSLYAGRPIRAREIGPVTLVERNGRVTLRFRNGALQLTTVGRALDAGGMGQMIRVMNLDSRRTIYGRISGRETVDVGS